ncbi:MAG: F0F1 ATP synthase subunit gamma [Pedobacter sp.]
MPALQELQHKIKSASDLHMVVRTMKALAAVSIRQYEDAVRALDGYYDAVELGLRAVLRDRPLTGRARPAGDTVALILGSDQGMAGRFNDAMLEYATGWLQRDADIKGAPECWVAGEKIAGGVEERFGDVRELFALPTSVQSITATVQEVLVRFERRRSHSECRLLLFHNRPLAGAAYEQQCVLLLPPDERWLRHMAGQKWPGRCLPMVAAPWEQSFPALISEYLFVTLFRGFATSLAAENAARLAAMQRAEKNIEELQADLQSRYHALRQTVITEELFDIISGFEALGGNDDRAGRYK